MPEMRMDASMEACTSFPMRGSRKFFSDGGPTLTTYVFLLLMMEEMIQIPI